MKTHIFRKGKHSLTPGEPFKLWQPADVKTLQWKVRFDETCRYTLPGVEQLDWLKGGGIAFDLFTNHRNSTMWGFRYNPNVDKVELNAYAHIGGLKTYTPWLAEVEPGETFTVKIYPGEEDYWTTHIITPTKEVKHTWIIPQKALFYRRIKAWFGGTLPAPQDVNMYMNFSKN